MAQQGRDFTVRRGSSNSLWKPKEGRTARRHQRQARSFIPQRVDARDGFEARDRPGIAAVEAELLVKVSTLQIQLSSRSVEDCSKETSSVTLDPSSFVFMGGKVAEPMPISVTLPIPSVLHDRNAFVVQPIVLADHHIHDVDSVPGKRFATHSVDEGVVEPQRLMVVHTKSRSGNKQKRGRTVCQHGPQEHAQGEDDEDRMDELEATGLRVADILTGSAVPR